MRHGSFVQQPDLFDNKRFAIGLAEARTIDPQHRLTLEHGYAALHDAKHTTASLLGSNVGVALGIYSMDWLQVITATPAARSPYITAAASLAIACGRVSFALGLQGPCLTVETACSAAFVAVYCSMSALRHQECNDYVAIGVNLMLAPSSSYALALAHMTSLTGRSHTFDKRADGFLRGEACEAVALQACLGDAAMKQLMHGIAVRQDGRSASLTAPNGTAQQALIDAALANGALTAKELCVFEAHGTGTSLGDPIESESLQGVLKRAGTASSAQFLGGIKANLGHTESVAGVTGLTALLSTLHSQVAPPNCALRVPNPPVGQSIRRAKLALQVQAGTY